MPAQFVLTDTPVDAAWQLLAPRPGSNWVVRAGSGAGRDADRRQGRRRRRRRQERPGRSRSPAVRRRSPSTARSRSTASARPRRRPSYSHRRQQPRRRARARRRRHDPLPSHHRLARRPDRRLRPRRAAGDSRACSTAVIADAPARRLLPDRGDGRDPDLLARHPRPGRDGRHRGLAQSDAQYRTEASGLADAIASEIALSVDRTDEATGAQHSPRSRFSRPPPTDDGGATARSTARSDTRRTPGVVDLLVGPQPSAAPGCPGAGDAQQQIFVDTAPVRFNRVEITLCWRTASDSALAPAHARDLCQLSAAMIARRPRRRARALARPVAGRDPGRRRHRHDRHPRDLPDRRGLEQAHPDDQLGRRCAGRRHAGAVQHRARPEAGRPRLRPAPARTIMGCNVGNRRRGARSPSRCGRSTSSPAPAARRTDQHPVRQLVVLRRPRHDFTARRRRRRRCGAAAASSRATSPSSRHAGAAAARRRAAS